MIHVFRNIALGNRSRKLRGFQRAASISARILSVLTVFIFLLDTINADVLVAALQGDVRFDDNPLILDSQFDVTSVAPDIGTNHHYFELAKYDGGPKAVHKHVVPRFLGTTIIEDVDSPTVLDGGSTATLNYSIHRTFYRIEVPQPTTHTTLDRTISFSCLLI